MRPVGILGGMGPEATILLMQKCLAAVASTATGPLDDADHIPLIVHQNPQVPSRIARLIEGQGPDPAPVLAQMARDLAAAGAQALAMPCNTAHHYADSLRAATALPFLDMITATADHLTQARARRIGMLASPATRLTGVFDRALAAQGLVPVWLSDDAPLLDLIRAVKAGQPLSGLAPRMTALCGLAVTRGADHLLVACTELSLLTDALPEGVPATDSLDCLTSQIVAFARPGVSSC
ncbi:MAG TPA: amino acid racemase [Paracoccaceae bacterium]|nr:amino acid racemase [Paracoccaceae bacterium]